MQFTTATERAPEGQPLSVLHVSADTDNVLLALVDVASNAFRWETTVT